MNIKPEFKTRQTSLEKLVGASSQKEDEPPFIKLYFNDIGKLWNLNPNTQKLFGELIQFIEYKKTMFHNVIKLIKADKKAIFEKIGWKEEHQSVYYRRAITELTNKKLLNKIADDLFIVSSDICSTADWSDIKLIKGLKLEIDYVASTRTLISFVSMQDDFTKESYKEIIEKPTIQPTKVKNHIPTVEEVEETTEIEDEFSILAD